MDVVSNYTYNVELDNIDEINLETYIIVHFYLLEIGAYFLHS